MRTCKLGVNSVKLAEEIDCVPVRTPFLASK
jgi:hypothetical protein